MPPAPSRVRKRDRTSAHLSRIAFELFDKSGYAAVSMEQIAEAAGVSKVTLYKYFPFKEALVAHRFREEIATGMKAFEAKFDSGEPFESAMRKLLAASAAWNESRRELMPHYLRFRFSDAGSNARFGSGTSQIVESLFRRAQNRGEIRADVPAEELARMFEMLCLGAVVSWLKDQRPALKRRFQMALDLTLHGASQRPKARRRINTQRNSK